MGPPLVVEADYRERRSETAKVLVEQGASVRFVPLEVGDYRLGNRVLVERKTAIDLRQSLFDGRLFQQASRLARTSSRALVLIEGPTPALRPEALDGALTTLSVVFGLPVLFAATPAESAKWILSAARQIVTDRQQAYVRQGWRPKGKRALQLYLLQGLPGVGPARAEALLNRFGSIRAVLTADEAALGAVAGIGTKTARGIVWLSS